jgi:hypothetical protein
MTWGIPHSGGDSLASSISLGTCSKFEAQRAQELIASLRKAIKEVEMNGVKTVRVLFRKP